MAFYRGADCCILCFDVTNIESFEALDTWREEFLRQAKPEDPENFPFVLLGNKSDIQDSERQVTVQKALNWCRSKNGIPYYETSAKTGENIELAFLITAKKAIEREHKTDMYLFLPDLNLSRLV